MDGYRFWQPEDWPWLSAAAAAGAWESLTAEERLRAAPETVAMIVTGQLAEFLRGPGGVGIVAVAGGMPVGFVAGAVGPDSSTEEPHGHILTVWVAPACRGRGLARGLLSRAETCFGRMGVRKVKAWTPLHNQAAVRLARHFGYTPGGLVGMKRLSHRPVMHLSESVT